MYEKKGGEKSILNYRWYFGERLKIPLLKMLMLFLCLANTDMEVMAAKSLWRRSWSE